jgi:hypothetical protein
MEVLVKQKKENNIKTTSEKFMLIFQHKKAGLLICVSLIIVIQLLTGAQTCVAQKPYSATLIAKMGTDTVMIETYNMVNNYLYGKAFIRIPEDYIGEFDIHFYPDGSIRTFKISAMDPGNSSVPFAGKSGVFSYYQNMLCQSDTCYWFASHLDGQPNKHPAPSMDFIGGWTPILSIYEWNALRLKNSGKTNLPLRMINDYIGVYEINIRAAGKDSLIFGGPFLEYARVKTNDEGRVISIDGTGTPWNYQVTRHEPMDIDLIAKRMMKTPSVGIPSPEVTEHFTVANSAIAIAYGKPYKRGRQIFGGIVPYDSLWRTGAGHPTVITLNDNIRIGKTAISKGKYSLYTIPQPDQWTLIFNTDTKRWPTDPYRNKDFAQVVLKVNKLKNPVEQFKIEITEARKNGGILKFIWDDVEAYTPFEVYK